MRSLQGVESLLNGMEGMKHFLSSFRDGLLREEPPVDHRRFSLMTAGKAQIVTNVRDQPFGRSLVVASGFSLACRVGKG